MSTTNYLLSIIAALLFFRFYPAEAWILGAFAIGGFALYGCYWLVARYPSERRRRKALRAQEAQDNAEHREWLANHTAIRAKYDPDNVWNEATHLPREYEEEIRNLNLAHRVMLKRRNDFDVDADDE
jgi:predicted membrane protein